MSYILIVDDDAQLRKSFEKLLIQEGFSVKTAEMGESALEMVKNSPPDVVIMDIRMPGISGLETLKLMQEIDKKLPVIIMTAFGTMETAVEATKLGAFDYILKPFEIPNILEMINKALETGRLMKSKVEMNVNPLEVPAEGIIGTSEAMQEVYKAIGKVAPTDATVLIRGESGTGKELVARAIYQYSLRADKPFLVINCVAIPETLLESELFGYEKGAFTGALSRKIGKIEQANHGTVFLDEIGDMHLSIQAKILRLLQEKSIERLGGREIIPVDVRIIAATNRNLEKALSEGRFREDLYYRLKVVTINLPSLKDRKADIPLLCDYFLAKFSKEMGIDNPGISEEAKMFAQNLPWHGNVRELANAIQKALIFNKGVPLQPEDISQAILGGSEHIYSLNKNVEKIIRQWLRHVIKIGGNQELFNSLLDKFTCMIIEETLFLTGGNRSRAAKILGISRPTLHAKIDKCGISCYEDDE